MCSKDIGFACSKYDVHYEPNGQHDWVTCTTFKCAQESSSIDNEGDYDISFENSKENGYNLNLELLTILY